MNSLTLLLIALACFAGGYRLYGVFLSRHFGVDANRSTPAHTCRDDVDYVPAKNWWVLFGHHFSSICGAGPIVGPVLACAYWGWGVSVFWIVLGSVLMGAVSDFSSLFVSMREKGSSVAHVAGIEISKKVKLYFSGFIWISLILVIAVFAIFAAKTFIAEPDTVVPSFGLIPTALAVGWFLYRTKVSNSIVTVCGLAVLMGLLFAGTRWHVLLPSAGILNPEALWILILLVYCFAASVVPVQVLLQPRDYLASFILFTMIALGIAGVAVTHPALQTDFYRGFIPDGIKEAGPLWPMLFVTIACGAISGFHSLVSSGTTSKQIASETHTCRIGYGGMLIESLVGILVIIAVSAGLQMSQLNALLREGGPIAAFSHGYGAISRVFLGDYGKAFAVLALNAFILTTLDTATRITRYITSELFGIQNKYLATSIVVVCSGLLALTGQWNLLWPAFGAANQLIAGIALLVASCWLLNRGKASIFTLVPAVLMLITTIGALGYQWTQSLARSGPSGGASPDWTILTVTTVLIAIAISIFWEAAQILAKKRTVFIQA